MGFAEHFGPGLLVGDEVSFRLVFFRLSLKGLGTEIPLTPGLI